jgi:hypothetical protein
MVARLSTSVLILMLAACSRHTGPQAAAPQSSATAAQTAAVTPPPATAPASIPANPQAAAPPPAAAPENEYGEPAKPSPTEPVAPPPAASAAMANSAPAPGIVVEPFTLAAGTRVHVWLAQRLDTKHSYGGEPFLAHIAEPIVIGDRVVVPKGTAVHGHVISARPSGRLRGRAQILLALDSLELNGRRYTMVTSVDDRVSRSHRRRNLGFIGGGAGGGAVIGALAGGGLGAVIGAGVGAGAGTVGAVVTGRKNVVLPPETRLSFVLRDPVRIRG